MRPINLIPPEERRGQNAPLRSGPLAYILLGALVAALVGVVALVLIGNQISDQEGELVQLKREDAAASAQAQRLAAYTQFRTMHEQQVATVTSLADSRFDWERVMRELALVLPDDVWLVNLTATASPGVSLEGSSGGGGGESHLRASVPGPALELSGCASGQDAVAGFITALKDIDGVTRVGVESSELPDPQEGAGSTEGSSSEGSAGGSEDCRTHQFIAKFSLVVAFDAAPVTGAGSEAAPISPTEQSEAASEETAKEGAEGSEGSGESG
jgi:Tfp pilus assembly protein PilN